MDLVRDIESLNKMMQKIKRIDKRIFTNFFFMDDEKKILISNKRLYIVDNDNLLLIFIKNTNFYRLYYYSNAMESLKNGLKKLDMNSEKKIVADLVGRKNDLSQMVDLFLESGFNLQTTFYRMAKINDNNITYSIDENLNLSFADYEDSKLIYKKVTKNFNELTEHLPSIEDIKLAIKKENILVVKDNGDIIAYLIFDRTSETSIYRYWYVDELYRGQKIGSKLTNRYFYECKDVKRFILWVESSNSNAIQKYMHYGFKKDKLVDYIMIK